MEKREVRALVLGTARELAEVVRLKHMPNS